MGDLGMKLVPRSYGMILEIRRGRARNRSRAVCEPLFVVGGNAECDMVLGDRQFGPIHFYLLSREGRITIRKVGSQPAISINGEMTSSGVLQDGDRIRTGPYEFVVKAA